MPTWLVERGFRFGMFAADCLEVPHVHVRGHGGTAKLWLLPVRIARVVGYTARDVREIDWIVRAHQLEFLENWNAFCRQAD